MLGKWEQPWLRVGWNEPFNYFYVNGERAGITLAIPWDERFRGARVTLPRGWKWIWGRGWTWRIPRGAVYPSVGRASIAEKQMATCYFPPWREWCSRGWCTLFPSRRNLAGVGRGWTARENNNKEVLDARNRYGKCVSVSRENLQFEITEIKTSIPYLCRWTVLK